VLCTFIQLASGLGLRLLMSSVPIFSVDVNVTLRVNSHRLDLIGVSTK